ncbi:MAG: diguanylate cyclase [Azovibrio sp.]|nr:diguanylate cyclase [Azovibrio sp.]
MHRAGRQLILGALAAVLLLNGVLALLAWQEREAAVLAAAAQAQHAAHMVLQRAETKLQQIDYLLTGISEVVAARGNGLRPDDLYLHRLLVRRNALADGVRWLFLVRPDGLLAVTSQDFPAPGIDVGDRRYFSEQKEDWERGLFVGEVLTSRVQGETFIPLSRRVVSDGGLFFGVIAAGMDPERLRGLLQAQELPPGFESGIFLPEGLPLACEMSLCATANLAEQPLFAAHLPHRQQGTVRGVPLLGAETVIGAYEASRRYPLVVAVQVPEAQLLAAWRDWLWGRVPAALGLNLALLALVGLAYRQFTRRREAVYALERANAELERRVAERTAQLQLSEARARAFMNTAMDAVVVIDGTSRILEFNPAAERMFAYRGEEVIGQSLSLLVPEELRAAHEAYVVRAGGRTDVRFMGQGREVQGRRRDGSRFPIEVTVGSACSAHGILHVGIIRDITERKEAEWQLQRLATVDGLTGVFNRRALMEQGEQLFALACRYDWDLAVMMLDADHFKAVNDHYGHHVGDAVLKRLAERVGAVLRSTDVLGRLGGEEFGIILPETDMDGARQLGERLLEAIRASGLRLDDGRELRFSVSIGVASRGAADADLDALFRRADAALYAAKRGGRDRLEAAPAS